MSFPDTLAIGPLERPANATVEVPGSKSITNRALVLAALFSKGQDCLLHGALRSEDTAVMAACLQQLGFAVKARWDACEIAVGSGGATAIIPAARADLFTANSGTTLRFLTALASLGKGRYRLDGVARMRQRPVEDLLSALGQLGVNARSETNNGCPPVVLQTDGWKGGQVKIKGDISSQFLSGLLMAATQAPGEVAIEVAGPLVSWPYVAMTLAMIHSWGGRIEVQDQSLFRISPCRGRGITDYDIEPDASAAGYFFAAAAITGGRVTVLGLPEKSLQGDLRFVDVLADMGCLVQRCAAGITVHGRPLHGIDVDMNDISDTVMTLGAVACFADGPTTIRNVGHIRHKESDRLSALAAELGRLGADVVERADGLTIRPGPLQGAQIETYNDHRLAMSLALVGLRVPGIVLKNPGCVAKTYPCFFEDLERLRG